MQKQIKSYWKYERRCGIAKQVEGQVVVAVPHPRYKGMWQFKWCGETWMCSEYAFDEGETKL